jgi:hypothetical protein
MTQTYNNQIAHSRKCNGLTLAEQMAVQLISIARWNGPASSTNATLQCLIAWDVHHTPLKAVAL